MLLERLCVAGSTQPQVARMDLHLRGRFQRLAINLLFGHRRPQPTVTRGLSAHLGVRIDDHRCTTASLRPFIAPCVQQETDVSILAGGRWIENGPYRATIRRASRIVEGCCHPGDRADGTLSAGVGRRTHMFAITGITGNVGGEVARNLLAANQGYPAISLNTERIFSCKASI